VNHRNTEWTGAERDEVFAEALHQPQNAEETSAQQEKFRAWLTDERYRHLWPMLERLVHAACASEANAPMPTRPRAAS
jgi:hypothetical protein